MCEYNASLELRFWKTLPDFSSREIQISVSSTISVEEADIPKSDEEIWKMVLRFFPSLQNKRVEEADIPRSDEEITKMILKLFPSRL